MSTRGRGQGRGRASVGVVVVLSTMLLAACPGADGTEPTTLIELTVRRARAPDPLFGASPATSLLVRVVREEPAEAPIDFFIDVSPDGTVASPEPLEAWGGSTRARLLVWGLTAEESPVALGRSLPLSIPEEGSVEASVVLARLGAFSLGKDAPALRRTGAVTVALADGRILLVGGQGEDGADAPPALYDHLAQSVIVIDDGPQGSGLAAVATSMGEAAAIVVGGEQAGSSSGVWVFDGQAFHVATAVVPAVRDATLTWLEGAGAAVLVGGEILGASPRAASDARVVLRPSGSDVVVAASTTAAPRAGHTATALHGGTALLVTGGRQAEGGPALDDVEHLRVTASAIEVLDAPTPANPAAAIALSSPRFGHLAVALDDNLVLLYGGADDGGPLADPAPLVWAGDAETGGLLPEDLDPTQVGLVLRRVGAGAVRLSGAEVLVVGGEEPASGVLLTLRGEVVAATTPVVGIDAAPFGDGAAMARRGGAVWRLPDEALVIAGGSASSNGVSGGQTVELELIVPCAFDQTCSP